MIKEFVKLIEELDILSGSFNWERCGVDIIASEIQRSVEFLKKNRVIFIKGSIRKVWWETFVSLIKEQELVGIIMVNHLPSDWSRPSGCILVDDLQEIVSKNIDGWLKCKKFLLPLQLKRNIKNIEFSFFSACGSGDYPRLILSRLLELLGISRFALTSCPEIKKSTLSVAVDCWNLNTFLSESAEGRRFDGHPVLKKENRKKMVWEYNSEEYNDVIAAMQKCHFVLSVDNNFAWADGNGYMTEKMFFSFLTGVPCVWLANNYKKNLLQGWGFRDSSDGLLIKSVDDLHSWAAAISVIERLVMNSPASQQWQDAQGERVYNNYKSLWQLGDHLNDLQWQHWQKIKDII